MKLLDCLIAGAVGYLVLGAILAALSGQWAWRAWLYQLFLVADQAFNVLLTPFHSGAWADETLSARAWRADRDGRLWGRLLRPVIDFLFAWQRAPGGHCQAAYANERARAHLPPEMRP